LIGHTLSPLNAIDSIAVWSERLRDRTGRLLEWQAVSSVVVDATSLAAISAGLLRFIVCTMCTALLPLRCGALIFDNLHLMLPLLLLTIVLLNGLRPAH